MVKKLTKKQKTKMVKNILRTTLLREWESAACAISRIEEQHAREIGNMAKDAFQEAALALLTKVRSFGYCSFCNEVLVTNSLEEAKAKQREHVITCPKVLEAIRERA